MLIFLVVTRFKNGYREECAFSSIQAARTCAARQEPGCDSELHEVLVMGEPGQPDLAYTIRWYDLTPDTQNVETIYGDYRHARLAVGNQAYVQELRIEASADDDHARQPHHALEDERHSSVVDFQRAMSWLQRNRARRQRASLHRLA
ncbi:MAG: hypothetical protein ACREX0_19305 [Noviherbaspirillum sp.]